MAIGVVLVAAMSMGMMAWSHREWQVLQTESQACQQEVDRVYATLQSAELSLAHLQLGQGDARQVLSQMDRAIESARSHAAMQQAHALDWMPMERPTPSSQTQWRQLAEQLLGVRQGFSLDNQAMPPDLGLSLIHI